jgi:aspartate carbamoyltransferase catalytic subunit
MRHVIESQQFDRPLLGELFAKADALENTRDDSLRGLILASLFYEPSTRTRFSFESAMLRLGGSILSTENAREFSSAAKGESLEDSIRITSLYADVITLRHYEDDAAQRAAAVSGVPIINAGSGKGQHPTQALLDLYTIKREHGHVDGLSIAFVGDLKHGRTVRSLAYLLGKFDNIRIRFISPPELRVGSDIKEYLERHHVEYSESDDLSSAAEHIGVLYQTRIQKERFEDPLQYELLKHSYRIDAALAARMRPGAIVMHPLPRVDEIATEVDRLPQAVYFKQARYGLLVRMALLKMIFGK